MVIYTATLDRISKAETLTRLEKVQNTMDSLQTAGVFTKEEFRNLVTTLADKRSSLRGTT